MKAARIVLVVTFLGAGCSSLDSWEPRARQLMASGQCQPARNLIDANARDPGLRASFVAATYMDCDRNPSEAWRYVHLAARYGNGWAQKMLADNGREVPSPDLAGGRQAPGPTVVIQAPRGGRQGTPSIVECDAPAMAPRSSTSIGMTNTERMNCR
jgi:hypothetical protein